MEDTKESEEVSDEKNHPLSREGWIMLLSGEINKEEMTLTTYWYTGLAISIAFLGVAVAFLVAACLSEVPLPDELLLSILALVMIFFMGLTWLIYQIRYHKPHQKRLKPLINIREAIISGELTDFGEIHSKWEEYRRKYYKKYLEKSDQIWLKKRKN